MRIYWLLAVMMIATALHAGQDRVEDFKQWCHAGMATFADIGRVSCGVVTKEELRTGSSSFVEAHIPLTRAEIAEREIMSRKMDAVFAEERRQRQRIIRAHGLHLSTDDRMFDHLGCGEDVYIRSDEPFIFVSVPDNPDFSGFGNLPQTDKCKAVRSAWRKIALYRADGSLAEKNKTNQAAQTPEEK